MTEIVSKLHRYKIDIDIDIQEDSWLKNEIEIESICYKLAEAVFTEVEFSKKVKHIEFSAIFTNNKSIQELNKDYRNKDKPTNVLSFPAEEIDPENFDEVEVFDGYLMLGDIFLAYETIIEEAKNLDKDFKSHFSHLFIHGLLHLLGYNHEDDDEAQIMEQLEVKILSIFDIESPYS